jgi:hypothetical protein
MRNHYQRTKDAGRQIPYPDYNKIRRERKKQLRDLLKDKDENARTYILADALLPGVYKIGKSSNPTSKRELTLEAQKPSIEWLYVLNRNVEKELHAKYENKNVRGEWYRLTRRELKQILKDYGFELAMTPNLHSLTKIEKIKWCRKKIYEEAMLSNAEDILFRYYLQLEYVKHLEVKIEQLTPKVLSIE